MRTEKRTEEKRTEAIGIQYEVDLTPSVLFLIFIAKVYKCDLETLLLLYDKIGESVFYMFFLFAGRSVVMPKHTRMVKVSQFTESMCEALQQGETPLLSGSRQENEIAAFIESLYDPSTGKLLIKTEIPHIAVGAPSCIEEEEE